MRRGWKLEKTLGGELHLRRAAAFLVLSLECLLVWSLANSGHELRANLRNEFSPNHSPQLSLMFDLPASRKRPDLPSRLFFPYSIIPGGAENEGELRRAIANDPLVAAHYQGFDLAKSRIVHLKHDRAAYVSYRLNGHVYWTKRKMRLARGESVITDGVITARTRCGNQISDVPAAPTSPAEPTTEVLEKPEDPALLATTGPPFELPVEPPPTTDIQPAPDHGGIFIPPIVPIFFGGPGSGPGIPVNPPPPPPPPPATQVPEPDTLLLLSVGLSSVWMIRRRRRN